MEAGKRPLAWPAIPWIISPMSAQEMLIEEIKQEAAGLPARSRGSLAAWLLDSLPPHSGEEATAESAAEAARRRDELDSGRVQAISSDEFWAAIERERASWR